MPELPSDISKIDSIQGTRPIESSDEGSTKPFADYMKTTPNPTAPTATQGQAPVEAPKANPTLTTAPTMDSVHNQMGQTLDSMKTMQDQLGTPNLKLKPYAKYLINNKLSEANSKIRDAATKVGVEVGDPPPSVGRNNPVVKFLSFLTDGTRQLNAAQAHIASLSKGGHSLRPAELLLVQVKLSRAQQEIEYASTILSNAVSSIKSLFNTQI
jgi:hypothetical protein